MKVKTRVNLPLRCKARVFAVVMVEYIGKMRERGRPTKEVSTRVEY